MGEFEEPPPHRGDTLNRRVNAEVKLKQHTYLRLGNRCRHVGEREPVVLGRR